MNEELLRNVITFIGFVFVLIGIYVFALMMWINTLEKRIKGLEQGRIEDMKHNAKMFKDIINYETYLAGAVSKGFTDISVVLNEEVIGKTALEYINKINRK